MKTLFVHAKANVKIDLSKVKLKGKIGLFTNVQFEEQLKNSEDKRFIYCGRILGCEVFNPLKYEDKVDSFLFIGTGKFHPLGLAYKTKKPVYIFNPFNKKLSVITKEEIEDFKRKEKTRLIKYYHAKNVGILVTVKPGQYHYRKYLNLKDKLRLTSNLKNKSDKNFYLFVCDTLDERELENFNFIDIWVNTACPRIELKNVINISEIKEL